MVKNIGSKPKGKWEREEGVPYVLTSSQHSVDLVKQRQGADGWKKDCEA